MELSLLGYPLNMEETGYSIKEKAEVNLGGMVDHKAEAHLGWMMDQKVKALLTGSYKNP